MHTPFGPPRGPHRARRPCRGPAPRLAGTGLRSSRARAAPRLQSLPRAERPDVRFRGTLRDMRPRLDKILTTFARNPVALTRAPSRRSATEEGDGQRPDDGRGGGRAVPPPGG